MGTHIRNTRMKPNGEARPRARSQRVTLPLAGLLSLASWLYLKAPTAAAEFPPCQPPDASEYLLLVISPEAAQRSRVQELIPSGTTPTVCNYFDNVVVRVGGFTALETANAWAQYLTNEVEAVRAFVARPTEPTTPAANPSTYTPQPLESGYAVLVDYRNRPEVALDIQQTIGQPVGLVAYRQNPYLLALQTSDLQAASTMLQRLSDRDLATMIVDSRQVVLLRSNVTTNLTEQAGN